MKGISNIVATGLLITIAVVLAVALYPYVHRMTSGTSSASAELTMISSRYVNNKPVYVMSLTVNSKAQTRYNITKIILLGTKPDGTVQTIAITSGTVPSGVSINPSLPIDLEPNAQANIALSVSGQKFVQFSAQVTLVDDAGNQITLQTNSVQTG